MNRRTALEWAPGAAGPLLGREVIVPLEDLTSPRDALSWQDRALCAEVGGDEWFPEKGGSTREAKRVCRACPVKMACLDYALENDERFGIWGGMSERERRRLKRTVDIADGLPAVRRCQSGQHFMTAGNVTGDGSCSACKLAAGRARRNRNQDKTRAATAA